MNIGEIIKRVDFEPIETDTPAPEEQAPVEVQPQEEPVSV